MQLPTNLLWYKCYTIFGAQSRSLSVWVSKTKCLFFSFPQVTPYYKHYKEDSTRFLYTMLLTRNIAKRQFCSLFLNIGKRGKGEKTRNFPKSSFSHNFCHWLHSLHPTYLPLKKRTKSEEWKVQYVRQSQYMLQIIKGSDLTCCKPSKTIYPMFFPKRFLPPPMPISASNNNLKIDPKKVSFRSLFQSFYLAWILNFDTCYNEYFPSLQERNPKNELYNETFSKIVNFIIRP